MARGKFSLFGKYSPVIFCTGDGFESYSFKEDPLALNMEFRKNIKVDWISNFPDGLSHYHMNDCTVSLGPSYSISSDSFDDGSVLMVVNNSEEKRDIVIKKLEADL